MMKTSGRRAVLMALLVGLGIDCSHRDASDSSGQTLGSIGLAITLPSGASVSTVHYGIKNGSNVEVSAGNINTSDPGATVSLTVGGIAAGAGYSIVLSATASDGTPCLGTSAPFTVVANQSVAVTVLLLCHPASSTGIINGLGVVDDCPVITSYVVSPTAASAGAAIDVSAAATDPDLGDTVSYRWTATAGTFDAAGSASTKYHCPAVSSAETLTITASDDLDPTSNAPKCSTAATIVVTCGLCGNGTVDVSAGEQCDPPNGITCRSDCRNIDDGSFCGNGIVQPGEQCDPPNGTTCGITCQFTHVECGDGIILPGEQCDPPDGITCNSACQIIPVVCGDGVISPVEQCDPPNGTTCDFRCVDIVCGNGIVQPSEDCDPPNGITCDNACRVIPGPAACRACEDQGTGSTTGTRCSANQRCDSLTDAKALSQCDAALACMRTTHCAVGGDNSLCYCSHAVQESGQCSTGMPDGPCVAVFEASDPNVLPGMTAEQRANTILQDLGDPSIPMALAGRQVRACDQGRCATPCAGQF